MERQVSDENNVEYPYYINCKIASIELSQSCNCLYRSNCFYECNDTTVYVASTKCTVANDKGLLYKDRLIQCITCTCTSVNNCTDCTQCTETIVCKNSISTISSYIHEIGTTDNYVCGCKFLGYTKLTEDNLGIDESSLSVYDNQYYIYDKTSKKYLCTICGEYPEKDACYTLRKITDYNKLYEYTYNSSKCEWNCTFKTLYVYDPFDGGKYVCDYTGVNGPMPAVYTDKPKPNGMEYFNGKEWQSTSANVSPYRAIYVAEGKLKEDKKSFDGRLICIVCYNKEWTNDTYSIDDGKYIVYTCKSLPICSKSMDEFDYYQLCGTVGEGNTGTFSNAEWYIAEKSK